MPEEVLQILLSILAGGLIGIEREYRNKSAGFRTMVLICVGATTFTMLSAIIGAAGNDPARIASNILTGIGFLGAGVILRDGGRIAGVTTASVIWLVAAIGMCIGYRQYALTGVVVGMAMFVLWILPGLEERLGRLHEVRTYTISLAIRPDVPDAVRAIFSKAGLRVMVVSVGKSGDTFTGQWLAIGTLRAHERVVGFLLSDEAVQAFHG